MRLSAVLFLVSMAVAGSAALKTLVFPAETNSAYVELTPLKPMDLKAFTLCMRVATELSGQRELILFAYRTSHDDELNVWVHNNGRLALYLQSSTEYIEFNVPQLGALETHVCVTWDSSTGATTFFLDGRKSVTKIYKKGISLRSGGQVIIGQDLDGLAGDFDEKQSFVGEIDDVDMWDYVLPDGTIQDLSSKKRVPRGNVFDWEAITLTASGNVVVLSHEL